MQNAAGQWEHAEQDGGRARQRDRRRAVWGRQGTSDSLRGKGC